jgi:hypothetical protein
VRRVHGDEADDVARPAVTAEAEPARDGSGEGAQALAVVCADGERPRLPGRQLQVPPEAGRRVRPVRERPRRREQVGGLVRGGGRIELDDAHDALGPAAR